jgi:Tfp pilus assembly protein PilO
MNLPTSNRGRIVMVGVLVFAVVYLGLWRPRSGQAAELRAERDQLSQDLAAIVPAAEVPADVAASDLALATAIPPTDALPELLRQLQSIAAETGVEQRAVAAQQPAAVVGVPGSAIALTITVTGPRAAAFEYVRRLGVLPRLLVVDSVTMVPSTDEPGADGAATDDAAAADQVQLAITGRVFTTAGPTTEATNG